MASYSIDIPGNDGVDMVTGDSLTIKFKTPAKFCIVSGNADDFNPALPVGIAEPKDYSWTGTATATNATITYSHVGKDDQCGSPSPKDTVPGTIKIGSGMK